MERLEPRVMESRDNKPVVAEMATGENLIMTRGSGDRASLATGLQRLGEHNKHCSNATKDGRW